MLSYIEDHEIEEAKDLIKELCDIPLPELDGTTIAVKLYIRPEEIKAIKRADGTIGKIYLPESITVHDKYRNCTALVISLGAACKDAPFRVGDWLLIPRNEGVQFSWYGHVLHFIESNRIYGAIRSPDIIAKI